MFQVDLNRGLLNGLRINQLFLYFESSLHKTN